MAIPMNTDRALATSPTLRDVISFKNGTRNGITLHVLILDWNL